MQKVILILCFAAFSAGIHAQESLTYSKVIQTDDISKESVYNGLRAWFAVSMKDANKVLVMDDKDAGILIGNTGISYSKGIFLAGYDGWVEFTIQINIREGRFKVEIKNISHKKRDTRAPVPDLGTITTGECPHKGINKKPNQDVWDDIKNKMNILSEKLFDELESAAKSNATGNSNDDW